MNRILKYPLCITCLFYIASLSSCVKDRNDLATDFSNLKPIIEIRDPISNDAGLAFFGKATVFVTSTEPDTAGFYVNIASTYPLTSDLTVTLDFDDAALATYNSTSDIQYEKFPDSTYSFTEKQITIPAGSHTGFVPIVWLLGKIDATKSYMLPISIKDAQGQNISGNFSTIYYHTIGNPLAGAYLWEFTRIPTMDGSGDPDTYWPDESTILVPVTTTEFEVQSGYYIGPRYVVSFTDSAGVLTDFTVKFNDDDVTTMKNNGVSVVQDPKILIADPIKKEFEFQYVAFNGSAYRYVIDRYYKP